MSKRNGSPKLIFRVAGVGIILVGLFLAFGLPAIFEAQGASTTNNAEFDRRRFDILGGSIGLGVALIVISFLFRQKKK